MFPLRTRGIRRVPLVYKFTVTCQGRDQMPDRQACRNRLRAGGACDAIGPHGPDAAFQPSMCRHPTKKELSDRNADPLVDQQRSAERSRFAGRFADEIRRDEIRRQATNLGRNPIGRYVRHTFGTHLRQTGCNSASADRLQLGIRPRGKPHAGNASIGRRYSTASLSKDTRPQ